jgi:predicted lipid-binding transport protein (Tim44 family)
MKKKIFMLTLVFVFAFTSFGFAAVSGSKAKPSSPPPAPKSSTMQKQAAPDTSTSGYKPSAPAGSLSDKAPAAKSATPPAAPKQSNSGFLGTLGAFGGGMLAGSLLGSMFGFGHMGAGMGSSMFGLLFDLIMLAAVFMAGRFLWNKFKNIAINNKKLQLPNGSWSFFAPLILLFAVL